MAQGFLAHDRLQVLVPLSPGNSSSQGILPVGKLPIALLKDLLALLAVPDARLLLGPGVGLDCAVVEGRETLLVLKSDPITFASDAIGWYAVQVNANDIATCGAIPRWMLVTLLLPEGKSTPHLVTGIAEDLAKASRAIGVIVVGGHTEITAGLERPIVIGTMIGEVSAERLVTPKGARSGDHLLLTKGVPIEATAILGREFGPRLLAGGVVTPQELEQAQQFLYEPGISILKEAQLATSVAQVHAMHDPTEGGLWGALWELAEASGHSLWVDVERVPIIPLAQRLCKALGIDPLGAIASGALLLAVSPQDVAPLGRAFEQANIPWADIGLVLEAEEQPQVWCGAQHERQRAPRPQRDALAALFEAEG